MIDYRKYPKNWKTEIRPRILRRAGERRWPDGEIEHEAKCEWCNLENHAWGVRYPSGRFDPLIEKPFDFELYETNGGRVIQIVLTVAHLDHDPENANVSDDRLKALCQRCHQSYDRQHRAQVEAARLERMQPMLLEGAPV